jgi:hypothetical protein
LKKWNIVNKITNNFQDDGQNEPSHRRQKGRPKKGQKMRSPQEPKKGER